MRRATLCSLATALLLAPTTYSLELIKRSDPAVVQFDIARQDVPDPVERDRVRRQGKTVQQVLDNKKTLYYCNITLGTPPQDVRTHIDTGSSDLWVNSPDTDICSSLQRLCQAGGTFDANSSSTYNYVNSDFNISYVDGSGSVGDYVTDTMTIGDATLKDFQFGIGYQSSSQDGVLGIGYAVNEVQAGKNGDKPYANLPQALVDQGKIRSKAYSLWLNDLDANTGSILFGGVNTDKYHGELQTLPILSIQGVFAILAIAMTGLTISSGSQSQSISSRPIPVLLDSGSTLSYMPNRIARQIYEAVDATYEPSLQTAYVPCSMMDADGQFEFSFSGVKISVGMDELVLESKNRDGSQPTFTDGTPACVFGIAPAEGGTPILGDTFLRSAYVVYDLDNNEISLASTNFNSTSDHILEIGTGSNSVPDATGVASAVTSVQVTDTAGGPINGPSMTGIITGTSEAMAPTNAPAVHAGLSVGAGLVGAGMMFAAM